MDEQGAVAPETVETKIATAADGKLNGKGDDGVVTLSTGIKLKVTPLPPLTMMEALTIIPRPKPPVYYDERTKRNIENPDHPDYKDQVAKYEMDYAMGVMNAMILFGVEVLSAPKGTPAVDSNDWVEKLELSGLPTLPKSANWRKLAWIKTVAVANGKDSDLIMESVGRASGVREADVDVAAQAFRSQKE